MNTKLSIIILNYNTKFITLEAIKSIEKNYQKEILFGEFEIIVADNASPDNSLSLFNEFKKKTKIKSFIVCDNKENIGFSKGNNQAIKLARGKYILILNPDTITPPKTLTHLLTYLENHSDVGAVTCKLISPEGQLDPNCIRGFPTPWNSFCHFSGLGKFFPSIKIFNGYMQSRWRNVNQAQEVEAIEGAFMLMPKKIGDEIGWFDEDYFFYGEDLQLCLDIHRSGYKIIYMPEVNIIHYGGASSGIKKQSEKITTAGLEIKMKVQNYRFNAMRIFFQKNYSANYPKIVNWFIKLGINYLLNKNLNKIKNRYS